MLEGSDGEDGRAGGTEVIFAIQRYLEDYFDHCGFGDPDQYAVGLAKLYDRERRRGTKAAFHGAMRRIRTVFYKRNTRLQRDEFERKVLGLLDSKFKKKGYRGLPPASPQALRWRADAW